MVSFDLDAGLANRVDAIGGQIGEPDGNTLLQTMSMSYLVGESAGRFFLRDFERNEPPQLVASSPDPIALQRLLVVNIGEEYRWQHKMAKIALPSQVDEIKEGYETWQSGKHEWMLKRGDSFVPFTSHSGFVHRVVSYSHIADLPMDALVRTYTDPQAQPCFPNFLTDR